MQWTLYTDYIRIIFSVDSLIQQYGNEREKY